MPKTKASKRRANLGTYAKKKPRLQVTAEESDSESARFSDALSDVEPLVPTPAAEIEDSEAPEDVLAWDDEEVEELASHLRSNFMRRLQKALRTQEEKDSARTRPARYTKIYPTSRTTFRSRQQKIKKQTAHLRANGYPDIRSFWPLPPSREPEIPQAEVVSDSDPEDEHPGAKSAPGKQSGSARGPGTDSESGVEGVSDSPLSDGDLEGYSDTEKQASNTERLEDPKDRRSISWSPNEENEILSEDVMSSPTIRTESQTSGPTTAHLSLADSLPIPGPIAQPPLQQGAALPTLTVVDIPMGQAWRPPPKESKAVLEAIRTLSLDIKDKELHPNVRGRLVAMLAFLRYFANGTLNKTWTEASNLAAIGAGKGKELGRRLREWTRAYLADRKALPKIHCHNATKALIEDDEVRQEVQLHLLGVGKYFTAADIVEYSGRPEVMERWGRSAPISERTAQRWLHAMQYRYGEEKKGCYVDGHERKDVVDYRQDVFLASWSEHERKMMVWDKEGKVISQPEPEVASGASPTFYRIVPIAHDESTFYAHDQRKTRWIPLSEGPVPVRKGDGTSLMVSDFCSPDLPGGWLRSNDGKQEARVFFKAGKNRDGYFSNDDILETTRNAIDLFETHFPPGSGVKALFMFDNAKTHQKRAPNALSARKMPKSTRHWPPSGPKMRDATFNRRPQPLYFPNDHPNPEKAGRFKGMEVILRERNLWPSSGLRAECEGFKCADPDRKPDCCARRLLFNQPDFMNQKCLLQELVESRGHEFLFYPKFHCELNFIEMCWGRAKYAYRMYGIPRNEAQQEEYVRRALDSVPYQSMQRFANRSARFMDAYRQGLSGSQAAWANRKYHSHRTLPPELVLEIKEKIK